MAGSVGHRSCPTAMAPSRIPDALRPLYRKIDIDLLARNGDDSHKLAIPAIHVLDGSGRIVFALVDAGFTRCADPEAAVAAVERLGPGGGMA